jgi:hypothetical protein
MHILTDMTTCLTGGVTANDQPMRQSVVRAERDTVRLKTNVRRELFRASNRVPHANRMIPTGPSDLPAAGTGRNVSELVRMAAQRVCEPLVGWEQSAKRLFRDAREVPSLFRKRQFRQVAVETLLLAETARDAQDLGDDSSAS